MTTTNTVDGVREVVALLRRTDPNFTLLSVELLLLISKQPGLPQVELAEKVGMSTANTSRAIAEILMIKHGFVRQEEGVENRKKKHIHLTAKGERFVQELSACVR